MEGSNTTNTKQQQGKRNFERKALGNFGIKLYINSTWSFGGQNGGKRLQKSAL